MRQVQYISQKGDKLVSTCPQMQARSRRAFTSTCLLTETSQEPSQVGSGASVAADGAPDALPLVGG